MVLPGMREPLQPVPNPDIIAAARAAELAEGGEFERLAIKAANFSVFILLVVVLLFTMLTSGPDKKQKASKSAKTKDARYTAEEVAKHCTAVRRLARQLAPPHRRPCSAPHSSPRGPARAAAAASALRRRTLVGPASLTPLCASSPRTTCGSSSRARCTT